MSIDIAVAAADGSVLTDLQRSRGHCFVQNRRLVSSGFPAFSDNLASPINEMDFATRKAGVASTTPAFLIIQRA